eukprot:gene12195-13332_t
MSAKPTSHPSFLQSQPPIRQPSSEPSLQPSSHPSQYPSSLPSSFSSSQPTSQPSSLLYSFPSTQPLQKIIPSLQPTGLPTCEVMSITLPISPTSRLSSEPSSTPTPPSHPSLTPLSKHSSIPTSRPSFNSITLSSSPSFRLSSQPTSHATSSPSSRPTAKLSLIPTAADATVTHSLAVVPSTTSNTPSFSSVAISFVSKYLNLSSGDQGTVDSLLQVTSLASYLLHRANCSLTPNCTSLRRLPCYATPHTCGPCMTPSMIGTSGDANDHCYNPDDLSVSYNNVVGSSLKQCVGGCSGHGQCVFLSTLTNEEVSRECYEGDMVCTASCVCDVGYRSSAFGKCAEEVLGSADDLLARQTALKQVSEGVEAYVSMQETSDQTVKSWLSSVSEVVGGGTGNEILSSDTFTTLLDVLSYTMASASSLSDVTGSLSALPETLDKLASASLTSLSSSRRRRRLADESNSTDIVLGQVIAETLRNYTVLVGQGMAPGQAASTVVQRTFRLHVENIDLTSPPTPSSTATTTSTMTCTSSSSKNLSVRLPSSELEALRTATPTNRSNNVTVMCVAGDHSLKEVFCADVDKSFSVKCNGKEEKVVARCPSIKVVPTCIDVRGSVCRLIHYTESNVTCGCSLPSPTTTPANTLSRHLLETADNTTSSGGGSAVVDVQYVAMLKSIEESFVTTVVSASLLDASTVEDSWQVLVTLGSLVTVVIAALLFSHYADKEVCKKIEAEEKMIQHAKNTHYLSRYLQRPSNTPSYHKREESCLQPSSVFRTGEHQCLWQLQSQGTGQSQGQVGDCVYVTPDNSIKVVVFVAIFSALATTPIALLVDWIINVILVAPTASNSDKVRSSMKEMKDALSSFRSSFSTSHSLPRLLPVVPASEGEHKDDDVNRMSMDHKVSHDDDKIRISLKAREEFEEMRSALLCYREIALHTTDREEFNRLWGLTEDGQFRVMHLDDGLGVGVGKTHSIESIIEREIVELHYSLEKELLRFQEGSFGGESSGSSTSVVL